MQMHLSALSLSHKILTKTKKKKDILTETKKKKDRQHHCFSGRDPSIAQVLKKENHYIYPATSSSEHLKPNRNALGFHSPLHQLIQQSALQTLMLTPLWSPVPFGYVSIVHPNHCQPFTLWCGPAITQMAPTPSTHAYMYIRMYGQPA